MYREFLEHNIPVFGLHSHENGVCGCQNPECKAAGKHPISPNWSKITVYPEHLVTVLEDSGDFDTGYGVLLDGKLLVIDVDSKNGGVKSLEKLTSKYPELADPHRNMHVATGSGNGSCHIYTWLPDGSKRYRQHLDEYEGIDFKTSGFVVGPNSLHKSGRYYRITGGSISDIEDAPSGLIEELTADEQYAINVSGIVEMISDQEIVDMLEYIDPSCSYDEWIRIGMAIHQSTKGSGFALWDSWSRKCPDKYSTSSQNRQHWDSFGKIKDNQVTMRTLRAEAIKGGWTIEFDDVAPAPDDTPSIDTNDVDLLNPPGFVGEVARWIRSRCLHPRDKLATAAALYVVSSVGGMTTYDEFTRVSPNLYMFGVAGSATGKNDVLQAVFQLISEAGMAPALHGAIKSTAEIYRNLIEHQACLYAIDEFGEVLSGISQARSGDGASYLQGVIGTLMTAYTSAEGVMLIKGDEKREIIKVLASQISSIHKEYGQNPADERIASKLGTLQKQIKEAEVGIVNPYTCLYGTTTPELFNSLMTRDMVTSGFLGRCLIVEEHETNPYRNTKVAPKEIPPHILTTLSYLYLRGTVFTPQRVEATTEKMHVRTTPEAQALMNSVYDQFYQLSEHHKNTTGLEAIPRRGYELVCRVSLALAMESGVREVEHVKWAMAFVWRDIDRKIYVANANSAVDEKDRILSRILSKVPDDEGITRGVLINRSTSKTFPREIVEKAIDALVKGGRLRSETTNAKGRGPKSEKYYKE